MAEISGTGRLVMFLVESPNARVSISYGSGLRPSVLATMERGHGTKSNPSARVVIKLLDSGILKGREHADLRLTEKGQAIVCAEREKGWELVTQVGSKPHMRQENKEVADQGGI